MIDKLYDTFLFLFYETNIFLTLSILLSVVAALLCCTFLPLNRYRQTAFASFLTIALILGTCSLGLTSKAVREIGLKDYHLLVKKAGQHPILNKALVHFIHRNNNKINGFGLAVIKNQLSRLEREHIRRVIDKEKRNTRAVKF